jgi:hypothetical protein
LTEEIDDMGFDDVLAGNVYKPPEEPAVVSATPSAAAIEQVTAPVTAATPVPPGLTPAGVQAAKALIPPIKLDSVELAKLAREIAMDLRERVDILKDFKLTEAQYDFLEANNDFFKNALQSAVLEWHSPLSTMERIKLQSAAILEETLPALGARMQNKAEGLPGVVETAKFFAKNAGIGERGVGDAGAGERFTINIDLGGDQKITVSTSEGTEADQGGAAGGPHGGNGQAKSNPLSIQHEPEGPRELSTLPPFPQGTGG